MRNQHRQNFPTGGIEHQDVAIAYLTGGPTKVAQLYADNPGIPAEVSCKALGAIQEHGGDCLGLAVALTYIHSPSVMRHGFPQA